MNFEKINSYLHSSHAQEHLKRHLLLQYELCGGCSTYPCTILHTHIPITRPTTFSPLMDKRKIGIAKDCPHRTKVTPRYQYKSKLVECWKFFGTARPANHLTLPMWTVQGCWVCFLPRLEFKDQINDFPVSLQFHLQALQQKNQYILSIFLKSRRVWVSGQHYKQYPSLVLFLHSWVRMSWRGVIFGNSNHCSCFKKCSGVKARGVTFWV